MKLLIGVLTAQKFKARQLAVWETWGKEALLLPDVDFVFILGDPSLQLPLREGHVLKVPCPDTYPELPQKIRWFCAYALAHTQADYLFKCDDDTYVRPDRLLLAIKTDRRWQEVGGAIVRRNRVDRFYFHGGAGYVLHRRAALAMACYLTKQQGLEDYSVGEVLRQAGLNVFNDGRLNFWRRFVPKPDNHFITTHYANPQKMRAIHQQFTGTKS